jgi:hypothetical protein
VRVGRQRAHHADLASTRYGCARFNSSGQGPGRSYGTVSRKSFPERKGKYPKGRVSERPPFDMHLLLAKPDSSSFPLPKVLHISTNATWFDCWVRREKAGDNKGRAARREEQREGPRCTLPISATYDTRRSPCCCRITVLTCPLHDLCR